MEKGRLFSEWMPENEWWGRRSLFRGIHLRGFRITESGWLTHLGFPYFPWCGLIEERTKVSSALKNTKGITSSKKCAVELLIRLSRWKLPEALAKNCDCGGLLIVILSINLNRWPYQSQVVVAFEDHVSCTARQRATKLQAKTRKSFRQSFCLLLLSSSSPSPPTLAAKTEAINMARLLKYAYWICT